MSSAGIMSFTKNMAMITNIISQGNSRQNLPYQIKGMGLVVENMLTDNAKVDPNIIRTFQAADNAQGDTVYLQKTLEGLWKGISTVTMQGDNFRSKTLEAVHFGPWSGKNKPTSGSSWNSSAFDNILSYNRNYLSYCIPKGWSTKMSNNFGSNGAGVGTVGNLDLQYSLWYLWGAWFDEVLEQVTTAMMTSTQPIFDRDGVLTTPLSIRESLYEYMIRVFGGSFSSSMEQELEIFFNTGRASNSHTGSYRASEKELVNGPLLFTRAFFLKECYQSNSDSDYKDVIGQMSINSPGTYPYYYWQYPNTNIMQTVAQPSSRLSVAAGPVEMADPQKSATPQIINIKSADYKFTNTGVSPIWQAIGNPAQLIEFTDKAGSAAEVIRSLSQFGSAAKTSGRMQIGKYGKAKTKATFPYDGGIGIEQGTLPQLGFWNQGQDATGLTAQMTMVYESPAPQMNNFVSTSSAGSGTGAGTAGSGGTAPGTKIPTTDYQDLEVYAGKSKPTKPKRTWSPRGIKTYFSELSDNDTLSLNQTWLVIKIVPDQSHYDKIMKSWNKTQMGSLPRKQKKTVTNLIAQYPDYIEMAFAPEKPILIRRGPRSADGVAADTDWLEWKWSRNEPAVEVLKTSYFEFITIDDPDSGIKYTFKTPIGIIRLLVAPKLGTAVIDKWFEDNTLELTDLSNASINFIPWQINTSNPDFKPHSLVDSEGVAVDFYQRSPLTYDPDDLTKDYPDSYNIFFDRNQIRMEYFDADKLAQKEPILFAPVPWNDKNAKELDLNTEYLRLELLVETNTDTYTGFDYGAKEFKTEQLYFPGDERYLQLESIVFDEDGQMTSTSIEPAKVGSGRSISSIKVSSSMDLAKIEFRSGEEITLPDGLNRFFSAIEYGNGQTLSGIGIKMFIESYDAPINNNNELVESLKRSRTIKNIPISFVSRMADQIISTDGREDTELVGSGGLIYEDEVGNMVVMLPNPDSSKGLVKFKLIWK